MGTNYYWYEKHACPTCQREFPGRHIGKSSAGWCFSLHIYPNPEDGDIHVLEDWQKLYQSGIIRDEYGRIISAEKMTDIITKRFFPEGPEHNFDYHNFDYLGNHAEPGPNNLFRHQIDHSYCIGHGPGTWDYLVGDFC